jgi:hypothetical protein
MELDLGSAAVIDDVDEIAALLREHEDLACGDDDEPRLLKQTGSVDDGVPPLAELERLAKKRSIPWRAEYEQQVAAFFASDERVDAHGDIVRQNWNFDAYNANPVVPFAHDWHAPPIGNALDWQRRPREAKDYKGPALWMLLLFASEDDYEFAGQVNRLVKSRLLRGVSVGFKPLEVLHVEDPKEREKLGLGRWGLVFNKNQLLEVSVVTLPANQGALSVLARSRGLLAGDLQLYRELQRRTIKDADAWTRIDHTLRGLGRTLFPEHAFSRHRDHAAPIVEVERAKETPGATGSSDRRSTEADSATLAEIRDTLDALTLAVASLTATVEDIREERDDRLDVRELPDTDIDLSSVSDALERVHSKAGVA